MPSQEKTARNVKNWKMLYQLPHHIQKMSSVYWTEKKISIEYGPGIPNYGHTVHLFVVEEGLQVSSTENFTARMAIILKSVEYDGFRFGAAFSDMSIQ